MNNKTKECSLGSFEVIGGEVIVTDPCYDRDLKNKVENVKNGTWLASTVMTDANDW